MSSLILLDDPYSLDQLRSPRMNISIVRPLVDKYHDMYDISVGMITEHLRSLLLNAEKTDFILLASVLSASQSDAVPSGTIVSGPSSNCQLYSCSPLRACCYQNYTTLR